MSKISKLLSICYGLIIVFPKSLFEAFTQLVWGIVGLTLFMNIPIVDIPTEALSSLKLFTLLIINKWSSFLICLLLVSVYMNFQSLRKKELSK